METCTDVDIDSCTQQPPHNTSHIHEPEYVKIDTHIQHIVTTYIDTTYIDTNIQDRQIENVVTGDFEVRVFVSDVTYHQDFFFSSYMPLKIININSNCMKSIYYTKLF